MSTNDLLFARLRGLGWTEESGWLYAPQKSIWFELRPAVPHDLVRLRADMSSRLQRLVRLAAYSEYGADESLPDTEQFLKVLDEILG